MIRREQAILIAEDYFNGDFKANYCEHRFEYSESEKRWYGIVYLHEPDWGNPYAGDTTLYIPYEFYIDDSGKLTEMNYGYSMNELVWQYTRHTKQKGLTMSKDFVYTADFDIRADFTVPLFMSSDPDIKLDDTATMSLASMMSECLKSMYESVTVEAGSASIYLHSAYGCSPIQKLRRKKIDLNYLYSVTFSVMLPVSGAEINVFDRIDTNDKVREEIENDLAVGFAIELNNTNVLHVSDYSPKVTVKLENIHVDEGWLDDFDLDIINAVKYNLGMEFEGGNRRQFIEWIDELSRNHGIPTLKQLEFIAKIEDETGETFRGFTKEAATKFISDYVDNRESYDDYMGNCLNF